MRLFFKFLIVIFLLSSVVKAEEDPSLLLDHEDGQLDISGYLSQAYGFLPIPSLITEPAVGYGALVALVYLHDTFDGKESDSGRNIPPSVSGVVLAATENGTKLGGAFHLGYWLDDTIRTTTFVMSLNINIDLYSEQGNAIGMNIKGPLFYQSAKFRIADTNLFLGGYYIYGNSKIALDDKKQEDLPLNSEFKIGALAALAEYDSRDNTMSPDSGMLLSAQSAFYDEAFGGDYHFQRYKLQTLFYQPLQEKWTLDMRLGHESVSGDDVPFFMYPYTDMRGIPAMRYQAQQIALAEAQLRWQFRPRWTALVFGGVSKAYGKDQFFPDLIDTSFSDAPTRYTKGLGFRYLIAKKYGLRMGVDVASSQEDKAVYIQFGTAWKGL